MMMIWSEVLSIMGCGPGGKTVAVWSWLWIGVLFNILLTKLSASRIYAMES